jgi:hypothetical protein
MFNVGRLASKVRSVDFEIAAYSVSPVVALPRGDIGVAVDAESWREIPKEIIKAQGDAQQFCFMRVMKVFLGRMPKSCPDDHASLIFDDDEGFTPVRFQRFLQIRKRDSDAKNILGLFAIADPKSYIPLQAADFLAWETQKDQLRKMGG